MASRLRGFRKDKDKDKNQLSILRFVRHVDVKPQVNGSTSISNDSLFGDKDIGKICNGTSSSPNRLSDKPPLHQGSKLFYISPKPLTDAAINKRPIADAKESGFDISTVLKEKISPSSQNGHCKEEELPDLSIGGHLPRKRLRIMSDDEDEVNDIGDTVQVPSKKLCIDNEVSTIEGPPEDCANVPSPKKYGDEIIEKLIDTYADLYPNIDRMEIFEVMEHSEYDFEKMTRILDNLVKEKRNAQRMDLNKIKFAQKVQQRLAKVDEKERDRLLKNEDREVQKQKKAQEKERKKLMWKMKAQSCLQEDDEEEEDDYIGKTKVYQSDSSEDEDQDDESETTRNARNLVLNFFNEGSFPELSSIPGCSKKKCDVIMTVRPFENWQDLVSKFKSASNISTDLLNSAKDVIQMRNSVQRLMKQCERISAEIKNIVSQIIDGDITDGISKQPSILNPELKLKNYQLIGLNWIVLMHDQQLNGVLADEMGLGKTIQAISFLACLKERGELDEDLCLIVVPTSTLDNWARELELWCPSLGFLVYHGSQEERRGMRMAIVNQELDQNVHIIITTYNMVASSPEDRGLFKKLRFHTVTFDEAHMLKNMSSQRYENLMKIKCKRRLLLTGTPLQNNLVELMSILVFVMPKLFEGRKDELKKVFSMFPKAEGGIESKGRYERERILQAKRIMAPFFLRRLKEDVLKDLPLKCEEILRIPMAERQEEIYIETVKILSQRAKEKKEALEEIKLQELDEISQLQADIRVKSPNKSKTSEDSSANMLMTLRKMGNHPLLTRSLYTEEKIKEMSEILIKTTHKQSVLDYVIEDLVYMSDFEIHKTCLSLEPINKFKLDDIHITTSGKLAKFDEMLPKMKEAGDRVLIFSQFVIVLNILEDYLKIRGHSYRRLDGSTNVAERQELIDDFTEDNEIFIFLLSTRAGGLGINLTAANVVILHDIDFNPYNDKQAEDRCHRVGQTKPVRIYRFISENTIEEGMYQIACNKLQLEKDVTGNQDLDHKKSDVLALLKTALGVSTEIS